VLSAADFTFFLHDTHDTADTLPQTGDDDLSGLTRHGSFGRFTILDVLGAGGMGIVLAAYDPQLDRKVAIKVLRTRELAGELHDREAARLLREARAMAQLSHPHVATVYEAGEIEGRVYVAMEYISGVTLRAWLGEKKRSVADILDVFVKAGRGLAAGHQAGLIHRDFKPDNVLIGFDGRVRVIDFGLARPTNESDGEETQPGDSMTGPLFGTPLYMAPEQHLRRPLDARTDQFAFSVSLFEGIYGRPPFPAGSYPELSNAVITGELEEPTGNPEIPPRVALAIRRGLSPSPDERFPLMEVLLDELQPPPHRRRGIVIASVAIGAVVATVTSLAIVALTSGDAPDPCAGGRAQLAGVWDGPAFERMKTAFTASRHTHGPETADRVRAALDAYAETWLDSRRKVCEATKVRHEQSDATYDRRMECIADDLAELRALTALFATADGTTTDKAVPAVRALQKPDRCATLVPGDTSPKLAQRVPVGVLTAELAALNAHINTGKYGTVIDQARALVDRAKPMDYAPVLAEGRFLLGMAYSGISKPADAEREFRAALVDAARGKDDHLTAQLWIILIDVIGRQQGRYADGLALRSVAELAVLRADDDGKLARELAYEVAQVHLRQGEYKLAIASFDAALKLVSVDESSAGYMNNAIGGAYLRTGNLFGAKAAFDKSLAIMEKTLGPSHPDIALPLANLGAFAQAMGNFDEAITYHQRALKILEEVHPDTTEVGQTLYGLAVSANGREDYKGAVPYYERALAIFEKIDPNHPDIGLTLVGLADCREEVGDAARAIPEAERGLALLEKGSDKIQLAYAKYALAKALWSANRDRPRARALGLEARKGFAAGGMLAFNGLVAVDNWLKKTSTPAP
jgi:eukaryotic-like serine/threonine-protein kinase